MIKIELDAEKETFKMQSSSDSFEMAAEFATAWNEAIRRENIPEPYLSAMVVGAMYAMMESASIKTKVTPIKFAQTLLSRAQSPEKRKKYIERKRNENRRD